MFSRPSKPGLAWRHPALQGLRGWLNGIGKSVVPDLVCEILSPSTRCHDHLVKKPFYARIGVAFAWLVDAEAHLMFAHRFDAGEWRSIGTYSDETEAADPTI